MIGTSLPYKKRLSADDEDLSSCKSLRTAVSDVFCPLSKLLSYLQQNEPIVTLHPIAASKIEK